MYFLEVVLNHLDISAMGLIKKKKILCSTHPHNYHLEVLHDSGLLGSYF